MQCIGLNVCRPQRLRFTNHKIQSKHVEVAIRKYFSLVHMNHAVQKGPKKDVGKKASDESSSKKQPPRLEELVPSTASLEYEEEGKEERG